MATAAAILHLHGTAGRSITSAAAEAVRQLAVERARAVLLPSSSSSSSPLAEEEVANWAEPSHQAAQVAAEAGREVAWQQMTAQVEAAVGVTYRRPIDHIELSRTVAASGMVRHQKDRPSQYLASTIWSSAAHTPPSLSAFAFISITAQYGARSDAMQRSSGLSSMCQSDCFAKRKTRRSGL